MSKSKRRVIGRKMRQAAEIVLRWPGCSAKAVAERVGPHGSLQFGYRTVHRALKAGVIVDKNNGKISGRYKLYSPIPGFEVV